jgi:hypothetical protein
MSILHVVPSNPDLMYRRYFACDSAPEACTRCTMGECLRLRDPRVPVEPPPGPKAA